MSEPGIAYAEWHRTGSPGCGWPSDRVPNSHCLLDGIVQLGLLSCAEQETLIMSLVTADGLAFVRFTALECDGGLANVKDLMGVRCMEMPRLPEPWPCT